MKKKYIYLVLSIIVSNVIFALCATTSPLYPFCDESHCFFTVGKAMLNGQVLYRDILEQKGILTYLIQIPAYLISHTNFLGVYLIQAVLVTINTYFSVEILEKLKVSDFLSFVIICIYSSVIFTSKSLASAQVVEVYLMPCFTYSLYSMLKGDDGIGGRDMFINGIMAAFVLWSKFSQLGFYISLAGFDFIWNIIKKDNKKAFSNLGLFILGGLCVTVPCFLYFVYHDSVAELFKYYFFNNVSSYGEAINPINLIIGYLKAIKVELMTNIIMCIFCTAGAAYFIKSKIIDKYAKLSFGFVTALNFLMVFSHGIMYRYYFFAFFYVVLFGAAYLAELFEKLPQVVLRKQKTVAAITGVLCIIISFICIPCPNQFLKDPSELAQYQFAEYMNDKYENPTSIDFGFLDGGFYTVADTVPANWAYCLLNWDNEKMVEDQYNCILTKHTNFVITRSDVDIPDILPQNYDAVKTISQSRDRLYFSYTLWERKM